MKRSEFDELNTTNLAGKNYMGIQSCVYNGIIPDIEDIEDDYHVRFIPITEEDISLIKPSGISRVVYNAYVVIPSYLLYPANALSTIEMNALGLASIINNNDSRCNDAHMIHETIYNILQNVLYSGILDEIIDKALVLEKEYKESKGL